MVSRPLRQDSSVLTFPQVLLSAGNRVFFKSLIAFVKMIVMVMLISVIVPVIQKQKKRERETIHKCTKKGKKKLRT